MTAISPGAWIMAKYGDRFHLGTLIIKATGSFLIGVLMTLLIERWCFRAAERHRKLPIFPHNAHHAIQIDCRCMHAQNSNCNRAAPQRGGAMAVPENSPAKLINIETVCVYDTQAIARFSRSLCSSSSRVASMDSKALMYWAGREWALAPSTKNRLYHVYGHSPGSRLGC